MTAHDPRNLEWQRRYEEKDTPWDKGMAAPPLVHYLRENTIAGHVLVPGCGRGHDVRALARQPGCSVVGLDLAPAAVAEASRLDARETVEGESPSPDEDVATEPAPLAARAPFAVAFEAPFAVPSAPGGGRDGGLPQMSQ